MSDEKKDYNNSIFKSRVFPLLTDGNYNNFQIDVECCWYITDRFIADKMSVSILNACCEISDLKDKINDTGNQLIITDATSCVGGNTLSFAKLFKSVNSVEIDSKRYDQLVNNCKVCKVNNVICFNQDYVKIFDSLNQDVVFLDPPWGGKEYKNKKQIRLELSGVSLEMLCDKIFEKTKTKLVALKLPFNYDMEFFISSLQKINSDYNFKIKKFKNKILFVILFINNKQNDVINNLSKLTAK